MFVDSKAPVQTKSNLKARYLYKVYVRIQSELSHDLDEEVTLGVFLNFLDVVEVLLVQPDVLVAGHADFYLNESTTTLSTNGFILQ